MTKSKFLIAGLLSFCLMLTGLMAQQGFTVNRQTRLTVNEPILIPGKILPPGEYVMKLTESPTNRNIVQVWNADEDELQATIMAVDNYRQQPTGESEFEYWETPAGAPPALRAWFYPGDNFGQEFAYPEELANEIAAAHDNVRIPNYRLTEDLTPEQAVSVEILNLPEEPSPALAQNRPVDSQTNRNQTKASPSQGNPQSAVQDRGNNRPGIVAQEQSAGNAQNRQNQVLAQNQPAPNPVQTQNNTNQNNANDEITELPRTASPLPLLMLLGVGMLGGAALLRRRVLS